MKIRETSASDLNDILSVERAAFGSDEEADLVQNLLEDPSAKPLVSLLAFDEDRAIGHILFTNARLTQSTSSPSISLLAPLAVVPNKQRKGIGGKLIKSGLDILSRSGVELVFVLGHPEYYPKHGFNPAGCLGYNAPFPIPEEHADAWMIQALKPGIIENNQGKIMCADTMFKPEYWRE